MPKTDYNGQTILHLVRNDIVYNIMIIKDGEVLGTFNNIIAFCEDFTIGDCKLSLTAFDSVESVFDYNTELGITFNEPTFDETTRIITFNFLSTDGTAKEVLMNVTRSDIFGNRTVCEDSLTSAGGTLACSVNPNIDESILSVSVYVDGLDTAHSTVKLDDEGYGAGGYLVFFVMAITIILLFSGSKSGILISIFLSFVAAVGLNLIRGDVIGVGASGLWLILIVVLAIWKLNKERIQ
ncbi:unnamed protein product [marine sediment metagenome]|uniref:Uncharacterized protein n=1 Tax=marine sediment metagenome TaxID=412755 RepID=X1TTL9_9ZZZZ